MAFESDNDRIDALLSSADVDPNPTESVLQQPAQEQAPLVQTPAPQVEPGTTPAPAEDSFRGFDASLLAQLPPDVQAAVEAERRSLQGEATRKFQEAAELRNQFEGLDPTIARQSVQYVQSLADPTFLQAAHEAMSAELERLGYSPAQAADVASTQLQQQVDEYEDDGIVPQRIENELNELRQWRDNFESTRHQERELEELKTVALQQEQAVRQAHPDYTEDDLAYIYQLSWSTGANLIQADQVYQGIVNHAAKNLLAHKASIPSALSPPPAGGAAQEAPVHFKSLEEAHKAAMARIAVLDANS